MHETQTKLLELAETHDLSTIPLREIAKLIGKESMSPGVLQHHFTQLAKKQLLIIDRKAKVQQLGNARDDSRFHMIPIIGAASCGPANELAEESVEGYLQVSKGALSTSFEKLFAIRTVGSSMDNANAPTLTHEKAPIEDGDYVVVDARKLSLEENQNKYVLSIINGMANIKKLIKRDYDIALLSESKNENMYPPIIIGPDDDYMINGQVIAVVKS